MIYNNEQQLLKLEDELFDLALLGLLEIEGRKLMEERDQLVQRGEYPSPPADQVRRIEKMIRSSERKKVFQSAVRKISPVISKVAVWFLVFFLGTGTVVLASADIREAIYRLIVEQHQRYTQIELQQDDATGQEEYASCGAAYIPTYVPSQVELEGITETRYSIRASYQGGENAELFLIFRQTMRGFLYTFQSVGQSRFADRRVKFLCQFGQRQIRILHSDLGRLTQRFRQSVECSGLLQSFNGQLDLYSRLNTFSQIGSFTVGKPVCLVAHFIVQSLVHNAHSRSSGSHKGQQIFDVVGCLDINGIGALAQRAVRMKVMLCQHGFQLLRQIVARGKEFQIIAFFRVRHSATAKECRSNEGLHTFLAFEMFRPDP